MWYCYAQGEYSDICIYIRSFDPFFFFFFFFWGGGGSKFEFQYFRGVQKNRIFLGMNEEIVAIYCGSLHDWTILEWSHFYTF